MSIAFVQGKADPDLVGSRSGTTQTIAPTGAFTGGNGGVLGIFWKTNVTISSVTDTAGNVWTDCGAGRFTRPTDGFIQIYGCNNLAAGTPTITVTFSTTATEMGLDVLEYSGQDTTTLFDSVTATGTATSGTSVTTGSLTPTISDGAIVAYCVTDDTNGSAGASMTTRFAVATGGDIFEDRIFSSSVGTVTVSANMSAAITKGGILACVLRAAAVSTSAAVTGTITSSVIESDIVTGGKTIIITLTGDTWRTQ
jgi:hypothetical protein